MSLLRMDDPRALEQTIETIQRGGVVAFPTDTVYGIAASLQHQPALRRIFDVKGRTPSKTLPILMASPAVLELIGDQVDPRVVALAVRFWPGSLTVIVRGKPDLPPEVLADDGTIGVRVPDHSVALAIANRCGGAVAVTSANPSGGPPALRAEDIQATLGEVIDIVLDGGRARGGVASTVVRIGAGDPIEIIRQGTVTREALEAEWDAIRAEG